MFRITLQLLLCLTLSLTPILLFSQADDPVAQVVDSLKKQLQVLPDGDSKVGTYFFIGLNYRLYSSNDSAKKYYEAGMKLAKELDLQRGYHSLLNEYGALLQQLGRVQEGIQAKKEALAYFTAQNDSLKMVNIVLGISNLYHTAEQMDSSFVYCNRGMDLAEAINDSLHLCESYKAASILHVHFSDTLEAIRNANKALVIARRLNITHTETEILMGLGEIHTNFGSDFSKAKEYYQMAFQMTENSGNLNGMVRIKIGWAATFLKEGNEKKALSLLLEAVEIKEKIDYNEKDEWIYYNMAVCYDSLNQPQNAITYYLQALQAGNTYNITPSRFMPLMFERLSLLYEKQGKLPEALAFQRKLEVVKDSINNDNLVKTFTEMEFRFDLKQREKDIALLESQSDLQALQLESSQKRSLYLGGAALLLVILILTISYFMVQTRKSRQKLQTAHADLESLNHTKDRFFAIIAHDLRGPATSFQGLGEMINFYLENGREDRIRDLAAKLDRSADRLTLLLDNLLNWAFTQLNQVPYFPRTINIGQVAAEVADLYHDQAQSKNISLNLEIDNNSSAFADPDAVRLIFRNLIGNAIKFTPEGGKISLKTSIKNGRLEASVQDTGIGMSNEKLAKMFSLEQGQSSEGTKGEKGSGLGMVLCQEFLKVNNGGVKVVSEPGKGTEVSFYLPIE